MKSKIINYSFQVTIICVLIVGFLVGSIAAYADQVNGPYHLSSGWNTITDYIDNSPDCYSYWQQASVWSNGSDQLYVNWVEELGGWASNSPSQWNLAYLWTTNDPYSYDIVYGFGAIPIDSGEDVTVNIQKYYSVPSGYDLEFGQYSYVYCPGFWNPTDGWVAYP